MNAPTEVTQLEHSELDMGPPVTTSVPQPAISLAPDEILMPGEAV